ncbi:MAG TPA: OmpA family protein [Longimicrobiales bacterium]|nr:OmpA family protein [Longimicrobiales bacterium]
MRRHVALMLCLAALLAAPASAQLAGIKRAREAAQKLLAEDSAKAATQAAAKQDPKIWENYDFVPGSKVLFFTDFTEDRTGNFPGRLKFVGGAMDVVERDDVKVLRVTNRSTFLIPIGSKLPERFTLEIDVIAPRNGKVDMVSFEGGRELNRGDESANVTWNTTGAFILGSGLHMGNGAIDLPDAMQPGLIDNVTHLRVLMDGAYFKMYVNERRIYNIPELAFRRDSVIRVLTTGDEESPVYFTSIRVAESDTDVLYDALAANGRWATQGILFETGKADLKPESTPVLKEIASTLKQYADLKILIEGHTDNVGVAASNLTLSEARAAAVKEALVRDFGADGDRITTIGLGDTRPAVPNTTAEGRSQNRRVEVVKQ